MFHWPPWRIDTVKTVVSGARWDIQQVEVQNHAKSPKNKFWLCWGLGRQPINPQSICLANSSNYFQFYVLGLCVCWTFYLVGPIVVHKHNNHYNKKRQSKRIKNSNEHWIKEARSKGNSKKGKRRRENYRNNNKGNDDELRKTARNNYPKQNTRLNHVALNEQKEDNTNKRTNTSMERNLKEQEWH